MNRIRALDVFACILLVHAIYAQNFEKEGENFRILQPTNRTDYEERFKVLGKLLKLAFEKKYSDWETNEIDVLSTEALSGVYTECLFGLSFSCLQKKLITFLYELDKVKSINLIGKTVMVVRKREVNSDTTTLAKIDDHVDQTYLKEIIDNLVDKFFDNHFLRVKIPEYFDGKSRNDNDGTYVDIDFQNQESSSIREGRKKKRRRNRRRGNRRRGNRHRGGGHGHDGHGHGGHGHGGHGHGGHGHGGGGKMKGLKKMMMAVGLMTCAKLTMMGPLMLGLLGLKAMKALMMAVASLTISKMMMLSRVNLSSLIGQGGGGGGASEAISQGGHGGAGWDRNIQEVPPSPPTSALPYYIEPPSTFNSHKVYAQYTQYPK